MPNWCSNYVVIGGEPKKVSKLRSVLTHLKVTDKSENNTVFVSLIGYGDMTPEEYEKNWYNTNVDRFGTKWDVGIDDWEIDDDTIIFRGDTAWSPPVEAFKHIVDKFGVDVEMYYEEPGCDFCGKVLISADGEMDVIDYTYQEGIYRFEGFGEWWEREFEFNNKEWIIEELEDEGGNEDGSFDVPAKVRESFPFLNDSEVKECVDSIMEELTDKLGIQE